MPLLLNSPRAWGRIGCVVLALPVLWFVAAYPRGALMARIDHAAGNYVFLTGDPVPWEREARALLADKYGVRLRWAPGVMPWNVMYEDGYNAASRHLLQEKFGKDVIEECFSTAYREYRAKHPEQFGAD